MRGDETPPLPMSLICEAPCISCSRTRSRTSSAPSAMLAAPVRSMSGRRAARHAREVGQRTQVAVAAAAS